MFKVTKRIEIAGAHFLRLPYTSPCGRMHGHNWIIEVEVQAEKLDDNGMVVDFSLISEVVKKLDHKNLNETLNETLPIDINPTAENIATWIATELYKVIKAPTARVSKVTVQESEGNTACCIP